MHDSQRTRGRDGAVSRVREGEKAGGHIGVLWGELLMEAGRGVGFKHVAECERLDHNFAAFLRPEPA